MAIVYLFGDSITYGAWDVKNSGWASLVRRYLDGLQEKVPDLYFLVHNLGIPGDTTDGLLRRFESEYRARAREERGEENVFVFAFGANDSVFVPSRNGFAVPKDRFVSNMGAVIESAGKVSKKILLLNITPVNENLCVQRYSGKDKTRLNKNIEEYNALIAELAAKSDLPLVDVYSGFMDDMLSEDGLHPNEKGHQFIFGKVSGQLA